MKNRLRFLAIIIALFMCLNMLPIAAFAADGDPHTLTIYYKYADDTTAGTTYTSSVAEGAAYSVGSPTISGYTANPATVSGTMGTEDVTVTVTYAAIPATHTLTVYYKYADDTTAETTYTSSVAEGAAYSVGSPTISGYTANPATVSGTMGTEDVTVTVTYAAIPATHTLTVYYKYADDTTAGTTYTSSVAEGAAYSVGSPTISGYTANPATVSGTMGTEDVTVTVTYAAIPATHTLTVNYSVPEGVTAPEAHTEQVAENTSYSFTPPVITGHTANPATVSGTMGTEDVSVTVTYTAETATGNLTAAGGLLAASSDASDTSSELQDQPSRATYKVTVTNGTGGTATGGGEGIAANTNITVTATANAGYKFLNWTENGSVVSSAASYAFAVTADRVLVANFEQINYDVKIVTPAHGKITADKATAHYGDTVTLTIAADTGYEFTGLEVKKPDGSKLTVNNNAFTMPDCNVTVSATFEAIIYSVTGGANGSWIKGTLLPYSITAKRSPTDNCAGHFTGVVIDNTILPITDYTVSYGSVVVTIMPYALQRLSNGVHTVTLWFDDGIVSTFLYIWADPRYPATGDERQTTMWAALSGSTLLGMGAILILGRIYGKKKKKNKD